MDVASFQPLREQIPLAQPDWAVNVASLRPLGKLRASSVPPTWCIGLEYFSMILGGTSDAFSFEPRVFHPSRVVHFRNYFRGILGQVARV